MHRPVKSQARRIMTIFGASIMLIHRVVTKNFYTKWKLVSQCLVFMDGPWHTRTHSKEYLNNSQLSKKIKLAEYISGVCFLEKSRGWAFAIKWLMGWSLSKVKCTHRMYAMHLSYLLTRTLPAICVHWKSSGASSSALLSWFSSHTFFRFHFLFVF